jgi:hypothetical protein
MKVVFRLVIGRWLVDAVRDWLWQAIVDYGFGRGKAGAACRHARKCSGGVGRGDADADGSGRLAVTSTRHTECACYGGQTMSVSFLSPVGKAPIFAPTTSSARVR